MKLDLQLLIYAAWVVVAIAAAASLILSRVRGDAALPRILRSRSSPILPIDREELQDQIGAGIRVTLVLTALASVVCAYLGRSGGWWLAILLSVAVVGPFVTIPMGVVHTVLLRLLAFRGVVVSVAAGLVVGTLAGRIIGNGEYATPFVTYGGVYGLIVGVRHVMLTSRGIVPDDFAT